MSFEGRTNVVAKLRLVREDAGADGAARSASDPPTGGARDDAAELNLRLLRPLVRYLEEEKGAAVLTAVAAEVGMGPDELARGTVWVSARRFDALLTAARAHMEDDDELRRACAWRMAEEYGPLRFVVRATTPLNLFRQAAKNFGVISRISTLDVQEAPNNHVRVTYRTDAVEGRLSCLSRQSQMAAAPTLWGLPKAALDEKGCVAHGDEACVYEIQLYQHRRWLPIFVGMLLGGAVGWMLFAWQSVWALGALSVLSGGLLGYAYEMSRTHRANLAIGEEANEALRELSREEAEARLEIVDLHARQRRWTQLLEEQLTERHGTMQRMVEQIERAGEDRVATLRGVSHDLNNPLLVLMSHISLLSADGADREVVEDMETAVDRMRALLRELMQNLTGESAVPWRHEHLDVSRITEHARRRMKALVFGRDIRVSVFRSREAPDAIRCDPVLFDRVVDNLFTNAAKYTDAGSIVVEVGGRPGHLTLKVSDTGRGIPDERLEDIFRPGGSEEAARAPGSFGVGLSVVVQLLSQLGGHLDVMSKPGVGTTFWAHFPIEPATTPRRLGGSDSVLTIRRNTD